ncbi:MAG: D-glucuronate isomerase [Verrucomicrobiales bacterium]|nr:D-glucuronate isomerase [Verrucomicrobiales bacterium]
MPFIHDDFLLATPLARRLYHEAAVRQPIIDFHSHLPPQDVAEDRRFANLFEIWLAGDHYKWRAMRANGEPEAFCTGDAAPYGKFLALARTIPHCLRNPLYHWCHLELKRYFEIDELLTPESAPRIWEQANARLTGPDRTARGILSDFKVEVVGTTDDPADPLTHHEAIAASNCATRILPTFRPDNVLKIRQPAFFNSWIEKLERASGTDATTFRGLLRALEKRHDDFHAAGSRLSDHGLTQATDCFCTMAEAAAIYDKARRSLPVTPDEERQFATFIMVHTGRLDARKGWTMQLHLGPLRGNSTRQLHALGPDTGFDSIGDFPQARALSRFLDHLDTDGCLPKTVLYNINPADNYVIGTMCGNFMDGSTAGKIQFGSGWWFLDQKEGMEWQINALSNLGLLSHWVGMLTDSRSFMSFPRHEYFRRVFCNLLARDAAAGEVPDDFELLSALVERVCYGNARKYFGFYD